MENSKRVWIDPRTHKRYTSIPKQRFLLSGLPTSALVETFIPNERVKKALEIKPEITQVYRRKDPNLKQVVVKEKKLKKLKSKL